MTAREYAECKRMMEWFYSDPDFRLHASDEIAAHFKKSGIALDAETVLDAIHRICRGNPAEEEITANPFLKEYTARSRAIVREEERLVARDRYAAESLWRYANIVRNRCFLESAAMREHPNIHYFPAAFELSSGCRVQCPFCGFQAKPWQENYLYTKEHRQLWRDVLTITRELLGDIADICPCYFGTEPMDNPDYEKFLADMRDIYGTVPQTTSAAAQRDPDRTKSLLSWIGPDCLRQRVSYRMSATSLQHFRQLMDLFTPMELEYVEVLSNNPESVNRYSESGRAVQGKKLPKEKLLRYSISCIAGVRVNMVDGLMEFIEPELPSEQFPKGYRVWGTAEFHDAESFRSGLTQLFRSHAFGSLPLWSPVQINRNVRMLVGERLTETKWIPEENSTGTGKKQIVLLADKAGYYMDAHPVLLQAMQQLQHPQEPGNVLRGLNLGAAGTDRVLNLLQELYWRGYLCRA